MTGFHRCIALLRLHHVRYARVVRTLSSTVVLGVYETEVQLTKERQQGHCTSQASRITIGDQYMPPSQPACCARLLKLPDARGHGRSLPYSRVLLRLCQE
jgi:hypothetical protein